MVCGEYRMRNFIVDSWNGVMDYRFNPLKHIPDLQVRHMMLQVLDKINPMNKKKIMDILDKGTKNDFMKVHGAVMKAIR